MYRCSKCNLAVIIVPDKEPIRACNCKKENGEKSSIIMDMNAVAKGRSQFKQK